MITILKWILCHPWLAHVVSFIGMTGLACPQYRMRAGFSVGLVQYVRDSVFSAVRLPGFGLWVFVPLPFLDLVFAATVWALALWPLQHCDTRRGILLSYVVLVPLWGLYALGWSFAHSYRGH